MEIGRKKSARTVLWWTCGGVRQTRTAIVFYQQVKAVNELQAHEKSTATFRREKDIFMRARDPMVATRLFVTHMASLL